LVEKKGIEYAIRAVAAVVRTGRAVQYDIIGDGPLRPHLSKLVEQLAMSSFVTIHGSKRKPEVVAMLMSSHMLLAPSVTAANGDQEGIPVALMEAMATGLPVVSTWHSGIPELVSDGESGFLVEERDVGSLEERLIYLLDHPDIRARMGQRGRMFVEAQFEIDKLNDRLVEIFTECLNNRNFDKSSSACQAQRA
jgi:colanic acid/amylovoran biosynthesis glycosyltransferase